MDNIKLFVLDMDGLMFDTGRLSYRGYLKAAKKHNYELIHNVYYYLTGRNEKHIREHMKVLYGREVPTEEWRDSINRYKDKILEEEKRVYKKKGLIELLQYAKSQGIKVAIASSSPREKVDYYLEIENISEYINTIVAGDEVKESKPNPEIFLTACKKSGIKNTEAVVFEDSSVGIEAAQRAGIRSILIQDDITSLPTNKGYYKLKKDLSALRKTIPYTDYKFMDLLEVRDFLNNINR